MADGIPFTSFAVDDVQQEYERLRGLGVTFTQEPTVDGPGHDGGARRHLRQPDADRRHVTGLGGPRFDAVSAAISVTGLVKTFGPTRALDGLDLEVATGEVHGFLGPNGSGKSTTIRVLLGLLRPDSGAVRLLDGDPWDDAVALHRRLAYVPGDVTLWPQITGGEAIDLLGRLRGGIDPARRAELLERFDLDPTKKSRSYSKGNRQKVALVAALASDAELLILDEPTSGLDPLMEASSSSSTTRWCRTMNATASTANAPPSVIPCSCVRLPRPPTA